MQTLDLTQHKTRQINQRLHEQKVECTEREWLIENAQGEHNLACGLDQNISVDIKGPVGYYCAGMNQKAHVTVYGHAGQGVAENMMSGSVRIKGDVSQSAGATAHGGLLVIEGNAGARCGIAMKGVDIVVKGNVGHMSCFLGQAGNLLVCGDAGDGLGDSLYEVQIFVRGKVEGLGADCIEKEMRAEHLETVKDLLNRSGIDADPNEFRRYGSARTLYHFNVANQSAY
ncbi:protein glxC [Reinekea thalattae]|uniref:Protein glxC n=1 Tax=Reinekea thalattae TaxID=2593301 RepID=A0A5C8Z787_9GAMM|nr:protein glxC [Reinekea thalattae]TXR53164.1 protein glxC [Reinekea thalattae]